MFTSIFQSLASGFGALLDWFIGLFIGGLGLDLSEYLKIFPLLKTIYGILQSISFGLIAVIAGKNLAMFWLGSVDTGAMQDRPVNILLRSFIAAMAVYFGGYVLEFITEWAKIPYDQFLNLDANAGVISSGVLQGAAAIAEVGVAPTVAAADLAIAMLELLVLILIAINLFKLTVEVCERYILVGILVFTSPIIYPTISTKSTSQIFKRWCGMFVGALIMMSVSVIFLKLIVSGLSNLSAGAEGAADRTKIFFIRMFIVLATCKIAQRVDSYLQQLGLNVATTGGNMLDDILALAHTVGRGTRHASGGGVLGGAAGSIAARTPIGRGIKKAASDFAAGRSVKEAFAAGRKATADAYKSNTAVGRAISSAKEHADMARANAAAAGITDSKTVDAMAAKAGAKGAVVGFAAGTAKSVGNMIDPTMVAGHDNLKTGEQEKKDAEAVAKANAKMVKERGRDNYIGNEPLSEDMQSKVDSGRPISDKDAQASLEKSGVLSDDGKAFITDAQSGDDKEIGISDKARAAGLTMQSTADGQDYVAGPARSSGEFLANATNQAADIPDNVGASARTDESLGSDTERMEASRIARGEFATAKNTAIQTSIDQAPPAALERMLTGPTTVAGTREMTESVPVAPAPQRADESDDAYKERYSREMRSADAFYTQKSVEGGFNPYAVPVAEKVFSDVLPRGSTLMSYEASDGGVSMDRFGHAIDHGRTHVLTYATPEGTTEKVELLDKVAYSALSEREKLQTSYSTFTSASKTVFYVRGGVEEIIAEPVEHTPRRPANIITNLGSLSRRKKDDNPDKE